MTESGTLTLRIKCVNPADRSKVPEKLELSSETTVEATKTEISKQNEVPIEEQKLIYKGKVLNDSKTLGDYGR